MSHTCVSVRRTRDTYKVFYPGEYSGTDSPSVSRWGSQDRYAVECAPLPPPLDDVWVATDPLVGPYLVPECPVDEENRSFSRCTPVPGSSVTPTVLYTHVGTGTQAPPPQLSGPRLV